MVIGDLGCNLLSQISIANVGSGMYQVVFSIVVVLNGLIGMILFKKTLSCRQWLALVGICASIAMSAVAQMQVSSDITATILGLASAALATVFVSFVYVFANQVLEHEWDKPVPKALVLAQMLGVMEGSIIMIYFCSRVIPNWQTMVVQDMAEDATTKECVIGYAIYILICGVHQYSFYYACSLGPSGAVSAGVNKCLQTAALFFYF